LTAEPPAAPTGAAHADPENSAVVMLSGSWFVIGCVLVAALIAIVSHWAPVPVWVLAAEVFATIVGLFVFGSFKYQIHKNALTYGMLLVIIASFYGLATSEWHTEVANRGLFAWAREHLLTFHGLDDLVHADTLLFILGLTFFVSVIAQTRLLEGITFFLLRGNRGAVLPTVIAVTLVVSFTSGILDGVSMIGLSIRTLVIVMMLAAEPLASMRYAVMVCTVVTTVCGMWMAYGEPPNLIMRANLYPYLDNRFFLRYCAPAAVASYLVVAYTLRKRLGSRRINLAGLDVVDSNAQDVRFLQAMRHGEVLSAVELAEENAEELGPSADAVVKRLRKGEPLGLAMVREKVSEAVRKKLLAHFVVEDVAESLDRHYVLETEGNHDDAKRAQHACSKVLARAGRVRQKAQRIGAVALVPFVGMLIVHGLNHSVPLFLASFAGFFAALPAIGRLHKMRALALREARHEFAEYYFLVPLFLSISLLSEAGFFGGLQTLIQHGIDRLGHAHVASVQFLGCTFLSAILDNNVVADFASHALHNLDISVLHLFAMAQIAGYALGGCWTHIGSAQSVVAFAFIRRDLDETYTPVNWIKDMTPVVLGVLVLLIGLIYLEGALLAALG
jgi:Na+/H+ antiporter NhaD/arsenite permease-like protein